MQSENLRTFEIALHILRFLRLHSYLEIVQIAQIAHAHYTCSWYRKLLANCSTKDEERRQDNVTGDDLHAST